jgi:acyl transferase domain-containing protein
VKCRVFDDSASGIVKGEGSGVVILKKLSAAVADGDHIYGVSFQHFLNVC